MTINGNFALPGAPRRCSICRAPTELNDTCGASECQEAAAARCYAACLKPGTMRRERALQESARLGDIARAARARNNEAV